MSEEFRGRTLSAIKWSVSGDLVEQVIRSLFAIALARLLTPRDFGLLAMLAFFTQYLDLIADLGFADSLTQKENLTEAHRSSVFWLGLGTAAVLTIAVLVSAPWIAAFYGIDELAPLARILSALFLLDAVGTVPHVLLMRRLDFRALAWLQGGVALAAGTCAVVLAWRGFGAFSLAADVLVSAALNSILYAAICAWVPRFEIRLSALRELFPFSRNRLASRAVGASGRPLDQLIVGKLLGSSAIGLYSRAYNLIRFPVVYVTQSIVRPLFPSFALLQREVAEVRALFLQLAGMVAVAAVPMCLGLFATATPFILGLLGPQWRGAIPLLRVLCLASLVQSISTMATAIYLSQGRADLLLRLTAIQRAATLVGVVAGACWGIEGVAIGYTASALLVAVPTLAVGARLVDLRVSTVFVRVRPVLFAGIAMTAVVLTADAYLAGHFGMLQRLGLDIAAGALTYWAALALPRVDAYADVVALLRG